MPSRNQRRRAIRCLALSSILSALSVILLYIGAIFELFDITAVAAASLIVAFAVIEMKGKYPLMIWGVTSVLSLLLLPNKFAALCYFGLCGYYPMLKPPIEKLPRWLSMLLKFVFFNLVLGAIYLLATYLFHIPSEEMGYIWFYFGVGNVAMFLYDLALTRLCFFYFVRLRRQWKIDRYLKE